MSRLLLVLGVVAVSLAVVTAALAYRVPTTFERAQIQQAYRSWFIETNQRLYGWCKKPSTCNVHLVRLRVSVANPAFAMGSEVRKPPVIVQPGGVLLHKKYGTWRVIDAATYGLGCGKAPKAVRVDLELVCTGGK